ncbi:hypothetical protein [Streptomyces sp. NPDC054784]
MATTRDLERLAEHVKERRHELEKGTRDIAAAAGLARATVIRVEDGEAIRDLNYAKLDAALGWARGSCLLVAEGSEPVKLDEKELAPGRTAATVPQADLHGEVKESVALTALAVTDGLTAEEIRTLSEKVAEDLARRGVI